MSVSQAVIQGDCIGRPINADVMIVDPPYSDHVHDNTTSQSVGGGVRRNDLGFASLTPELRAYIASEAAAVKRWSLIYSDIEGLGEWRAECEKAGATYIRAMPWVRWSMPQLSGDRPPQGFELITAYYGSGPGRKHWGGPGNLTHFDHKALRGDGKHKAEKPLDQALDLVLYFSDAGELVYGPCAGSGTVGAACAILGRSYIGIELDSEWADKADRRIKLAIEGIFDERDSERLARWHERHGREAEAAEKRKLNTDKMRNKLAAKKKPLIIID